MGCGLARRSLILHHDWIEEENILVGTAMARGVLIGGAEMNRVWPSIEGNEVPDPGSPSSPSPLLNSQPLTPLSPKGVVVLKGPVQAAGPGCRARLTGRDGAAGKGVAKFREGRDYKEVGPGCRNLKEWVLGLGGPTHWSPLPPRPLCRLPLLARTSRS